MHTTNTLVACNNALAGRFGLASDDVMLACSPLGHMNRLRRSDDARAAARLHCRAAGHLGRPAAGVTIMAAEGVTYTAASSPFLSDICEAVAAGAPRPARLRSFLCGGAPIPPVLIGARGARTRPEGVLAVGMTESLSSTLTEPARAHDKSAATTGARWRA